MLRSLWFLLLLALLAGGAAWIAGLESSVQVEVRKNLIGYRIDTTIGVLLAVIAACSVLLAVVYRVWGVLRSSPRRLGRARREWRRRRGYKALTQGMVAVAAGDAPEARRLAYKAEALLADPPLTMLLSAQAAQLSGDEKAAGKFFEAMSERPDSDTKYLGLHGQLSQAVQAGDSEGALELAEKARDLKPKTDSVTTTLFDLQVKNGNWAEAEETVRKMVRAKHLDAEDGRARRAALLYQESVEAEREGRLGDALGLVQKANGLVSGFVPAVVRVARLLAGAGKRRKAVAVIEEAWVSNPHPYLVEVMEEMSTGTGAQEHISAIERLAGYNRDHAESHVALAKAALAAGLWQETREHLEAAAGSDPPARVCRFMAELEELEKGDVEASREWLIKASLADPDPAWVCGHCGHALADWAPVCEKCGTFNPFTWETPPRVTRMAEPRARYGAANNAEGDAPFDSAPVDGDAPEAGSEAPAPGAAAVQIPPPDAEPGETGAPEARDTGADGDRG